MVRFRLLLPALLACAAFAAPAAATAAPAPRLAHPNAAGRALVVRFFTLLVHKDRAGLRAFLAPNFQVQHADGSAWGKTHYIAKLPVVLSFRITQVFASEADGSLVVRYQAIATGRVNGKPYTPGPAPRLSTFAWNGSQWQLVSHANFNPLSE